MLSGWPVRLRLYLSVSNVFGDLMLTIIAAACFGSSFRPFLLVVLISTVVLNMRFKKSTFMVASVTLVVTSVVFVDSSLNLLCLAAIKSQMSKSGSAPLNKKVSRYNPISMIVSHPHTIWMEVESTQTAIPLILRYNVIALNGRADVSVRSENDAQRRVVASIHRI